MVRSTNPSVRRLSDSRRENVAGDQGGPAFLGVWRVSIALRRRRQLAARSTPELHSNAHAQKRSDPVRSNGFALATLRLRLELLWRGLGSRRGPDAGDAVR